MAVVLAACGPAEPTIPTEALAPLPVAVTNNAVAAVAVEGHAYLVSALGLGTGKSWRHTNDAAFRYALETDRWSALPDVPGETGRLAGTALGLGGRVYVIGGYTVAADGAETSVPAVHALEPLTGEYHELAPMPVPVDDTVSLTYRDRYIILVSGWHDTDNVDLVQVYDTEQNAWRDGTPYPGSPVFGHAGGIVDNRMVICDGVKVTPGAGGRRFAMTDECYLGTIEDDQARSIRWQRLPAHPGDPLYRMAATGSPRRGEVIFAGGSNNPYNYNGVGYNGVPSEPSAEVFAYSLRIGEWVPYGRLDVASMDHRGLIEVGEDYYVIGGMREDQQVSDGVFRFTLTPRSSLP